MVSNSNIFVVDEAAKDSISGAPDKCLDDTQRDEEVAMVTGGIGKNDSIGSTNQPIYPNTTDDDDQQPDSPG